MFNGECLVAGGWNQKILMNEESKKVIETEGKDIEEAIQKGLKILGIKRKDAEIEVLFEENKGLFGMQGAKPAKVRIRVKR